MTDVYEAKAKNRVTEVLQALRYLSDALDRMNGRMRQEMAINSTDLAALRMLIIREQLGVTVSPHEVSDHLQITTASTTKLLDRLSDSGHLERRPHPADRRSLVVGLTEKARRTFMAHFGSRMAQMRDVAARFSPEELAVITRFLEEMAEEIDLQ